MDPLSIVASSIAIVTICSQVTALISKLVSGQHTDQLLQALYKEVGLFSTILNSVAAITKRPGLECIAENDGGDLWNTVTRILRSSKSTMRGLRKILRDVKEGIEAESLWRRSVAFLIFERKKNEIWDLLREIQSGKATLQIALQSANLFLDIHASSQSQKRDAQLLGEVKRIKKDIEHLKGKVKTSSFCNETPDTLDRAVKGSNKVYSERQIEYGSLQDCLNTSQLLVSQSASTISLRSAGSSAILCKQLSPTGSAIESHDSESELRATFERLSDLVKMHDPPTVAGIFFLKFCTLDPETKIKRREEISARLRLIADEDKWHDGWCFLIGGAFAITWGAAKELEILIGHGMRLEYSGDEDKNTYVSLLYHAVFVGNVSCAKVLLEAGAGLYPFECTSASTATNLLLTVACDDRRDKIFEISQPTQISFIELSLLHGADINAKTTDERLTAFQLALRQKRYSVACYLFNQGAYISDTDAMRLTLAIILNL